MTPSQQQAKDMQDEARRDQQADERIRELEKEVNRLRGALDPEFLINVANDIGGSAAAELKELAYLQKDALDGEGDDHASS